MIPVPSHGRIFHSLSPPTTLRYSYPGDQRLWCALSCGASVVFPNLLVVASPWDSRVDHSLLQALQIVCGHTRGVVAFVAFSSFVVCCSWALLSLKCESIYQTRWHGKACGIARQIVRIQTSWRWSNGLSSHSNFASSNQTLAAVGSCPTPGADAKLAWSSPWSIPFTAWFDLRCGKRATSLKRLFAQWTRRARSFVRRTSALGKPKRTVLAPATKTLLSMMGQLIHIVERW